MVTARMRLPFGDTEKFKIKVGLHQGSALSPFLSILVLDTLTGHIQTEIPWELNFADEIALIGRKEKELEKDPELAKGTENRRSEEECREVRNSDGEKARNSH